MTSLVLGPLLRHVGERDATVWVETDGPCTVEVRAGDVSATDQTFTVAGHCYAIVVLSGLQPGSTTAYEVRLDGGLAWPIPGSTYPPCLIRTIDPGRPFRLLFGSCRYATSAAAGDELGLGADILEVYARRMALQPSSHWPDALLLLGDQVYADETSPQVQEFIRARRDVTRPPGIDVADFEEYTRLYAESWGDPDVRWLLSTIPSSMIFDDHDVKDDWNTSHAWRREMQATTWWEERITGALMSYWVYQHLGNLSPATLAADETYRMVRQVPDAEAPLRAFAQAADREADGAKGALWSYRRDFGPVRLLVIDSRCGRILSDGRRSMVGEEEFGWIERQIEDGLYDHLLVGTSVPWLLPRALHDLESFDEAICAGARGSVLAGLGERRRRGVDREHWAAIRESFERLVGLVARVGRGETGATPPATICVLSGDVHHAYASEARYDRPLTSRVFQVTCSPLHNAVPRVMRWVFRISWNRRTARLTGALCRFARVAPPSIRWRTRSGPFFGNQIGLLELEGRSALLTLEQSSVPSADGTAPELAAVASVRLA